MFYGWRMVGVTFITLFVSVGFVFYSYGLFVLSLEKEFGESRFLTSLGLSFMNGAIALAAPFLGRAADSMSLRKMMATGGILMFIGFVLASQITAMWQFIFLLATVLGIGVAMIGQLPSTTLVSNWFVRRRGMALGIATMGVSASGVVMPPLTTVLITSMGWRQTFIVYGIVAAALVVPLVWLAVVNRPEDLELLPDGDTQPPPSADGDASHPHALGLQRLTLGTMMLNRDFWAIAVSVSLCFFAMSAVLVHMVPMSVDRGYTESQSAWILSACALSGVLGKVIFGWIADHVDTRLAFWASMGSQAVGVAGILYFDDLTMLILVGGVFGFGMGGIVPLWGTMTGEAFGRQNFGRATGFMSPFMFLIHAIGVPYAGYVYDVRGSYDFALKTFFVTYALAAICLFGLRRQDVDQRLKHELGIEEV